MIPTNNQELKKYLKREIDNLADVEDDTSYTELERLDSEVAYDLG
jgi:hypothetical protein|tara:strand:+ start:542 stop:676 length:135 start_codon:yes stop_codon:yes gene_type:complete